MNWQEWFFLLKYIKYNERYWDFLWTTVFCLSLKRTAESVISPFQITTCMYLFTKQNCGRTFRGTLGMISIVSREIANRIENFTSNFLYCFVWWEYFIVLWTVDGVYWTLVKLNYYCCIYLCGTIQNKSALQFKMRLNLLVLHIPDITSGESSVL